MNVSTHTQRMWLCPLSKHFCFSTWDVSPWGGCDNCPRSSRALCLEACPAAFPSGLLLVVGLGCG